VLQNKFELYDKDLSNSVDTYELTELYRSVGKFLVHIMLMK